MTLVCIYYTMFIVDLFYVYVYCCSHVVCCYLPGHTVMRHRRCCTKSYASDMIYHLKWTQLDAPTMENVK